MAKWKEAQKWEAGWWGNCVNTYGEEEKQIVYARKMGLRFFHNTKSPYNIDMDGKSVIDIGGGPVSLLLKCTGLVRATVVDPIEVPHWVELRYEEAGILFEQKPAEQIEAIGYDEAWIYNCLQHTANPKRIIGNALKAAKIVRLFEWIETHVNEGHPHSFTANQLDQWLGGEGKTEVLQYPTLRGKCYYGIFVGA
jgi:hypothetical protein